MAVEIRKSKQSDKGAISELFLLCYGYDWEFMSPLTYLDDRYYLLFDDGILVAMTGLSYSDEYEALEVDWTCTHPDYRHKWYMQMLFSRMLASINEDVYCSCWRLSTKKVPNLDSLMIMFGFEKVMDCRHHWQAPYNCHCSNTCKFSRGLECDCYEDLYLRSRCTQLN